MHTARSVFGASVSRANPTSFCPSTYASGTAYFFSMASSFLLSWATAPHSAAYFLSKETYSGVDSSVAAA